MVGGLLVFLVVWIVRVQPWSSRGTAWERLGAAFPRVTVLWRAHSSPYLIPGMARHGSWRTHPCINNAVHYCSPGRIGECQGSAKEHRRETLSVTRSDTNLFQHIRVVMYSNGWWGSAGAFRRMRKHTTLITVKQHQKHVQCPAIACCEHEERFHERNNIFENRFFQTFRPLGWLTKSSCSNDAVR